MVDSGKFKTTPLIKCVPQRPDSIDKCLLGEDVGFTHIDDDFAYKDDMVKMRIGRAIKKHCNEPTMVAFDEWKNDIANLKYVPMAVQEALERREFLKEYNYLAGFVGIFPSYRDNDLEWVISDDPVDLVNMSTGTDWSSCTKIGGSFGNAREWLRKGNNCNWCSDIEHGNLLLILRDKLTGRWIGRQSIRWCVIDSFGNKGIGIENWYSYRSLERDLEYEKDQLLADLASENDIKIDYHKCITPYYFGGVSDMEASGGIIKYYIREGSEDPLIYDLADELPDKFRDLADPTTDEVYLYDIGEDGAFTKFAMMYNDSDNPKVLINIIENADKYEFLTSNVTSLTKPIVRTLEKLLREKNKHIIRDKPIKFIYSRDEWEEWMDVPDFDKPSEDQYSNVITKGNRMINSMIHRRENHQRPYIASEWAMRGEGLKEFTPDTSKMPLMAILGRKHEGVPERLHPKSVSYHIHSPFSWDYHDLTSFTASINHAFNPDDPHHKSEYLWRRKQSELEKRIVGVIKRHTPPDDLHEYYAREYPFYF